MGKLTDVQIRAWIKQGEPLAKSDGDGLTFTLSKNKTAAWTLRYRFANRARELTIGRYPDIGLGRARELAAEARVKISQGIDVALEKLTAKRESIEAWTFRQLSSDYEEKRLPDLSPNSQKQRKHHLKLVNARFGTVPIKAISGAEVVSLIQHIGKKSYSVAEAVLTAVSEAFNHAVAIRAVASNPCIGIRTVSALGKAPPTRQRLMLSENELRAILPALPSIGAENSLALKIMFATCVRIGELAKAEWAHVDFDGTARWTHPNGDMIDVQEPKWLIPVENQKTGKTTGRHFVIPLLPPVIAWFQELKHLSGGSQFVLPARQGRRKSDDGDETHFEPRAINAMLHKFADRNSGKFRRFVPHDTRSTARSHLSALGIDPLIAERCLNHAVGGMIGIYDRFDYWIQRKRALQVWTDFLKACENGEAWLTPDNVIQFRGAA
jgi:integrase